MDQTFIDNPLNRDLIALLMVSNLPPMEKRIWVNMLENLTDEEKQDLKHNLEQEIDYEIKVEEKALKSFVHALQSRT